MFVFIDSIPPYIHYTEHVHPNHHALPLPPSYTCNARVHCCFNSTTLALSGRHRRAVGARRSTTSISSPSTGMDSANRSRGVAPTARARISTTRLPQQRGSRCTTGARSRVPSLSCSTETHARCIDMSATLPCACGAVRDWACVTGHALLWLPSLCCGCIGEKSVALATVAVLSVGMQVAAQAKCPTPAWASNGSRGHGLKPVTARVAASLIAPASSRLGRGRHGCHCAAAHVLICGIVNGVFPALAGKASRTGLAGQLCLPPGSTGLSPSGRGFVCIAPIVVIRHIFRSMCTAFVEIIPRVMQLQSAVTP